MRTKFEACRFLGKAAIRGNWIDIELARLICCWSHIPRLTKRVTRISAKISNRKEIIFAFGKNSLWVLVLQSPGIIPSDKPTRSELAGSREWYSIWEWLELPEDWELNPNYRTQGIVMLTLSCACAEIEICMIADGGGL
jgi:hypothetical protein